jgi:transcriptional regulator with XRE-family HTH domain
MTESYSKNIGRKIRAHRKAKKINQEQMAFALGVEQSQYSRLERGASVINLNQLHVIMGVLQLQLTDFL